MPSHSPYALYSLTINLVFSLRIIKNQRFLLVLKFLLPLLIFRLIQKNLSTFLLIIYLLGKYIIRVCVSYLCKILPRFLTLYHRYALFSFQGTNFHIELQSFRLYGGDEEDRTPDPLLARQVLSQLSYTPIG